MSANVAALPVKPTNAPWLEEPGGIVVSVRLTPKGGKDAIEGVEALANGKPVLKARVRAVPEAGKANAALARLLAAACGVAPGAVVLTGGGTGRVKTLRIDGEPAELAHRLALACRPAARKPSVRKAAAGQGAAGKASPMRGTNGAEPSAAAEVRAAGLGTES
ncbi:DUF167 family protein [Alsobacter sp. KACC 23698]|uniref:UPF0235 protein ABEG18_22635 n=1 Tax=Alsobacter sp. KACC 23698 TaxID=3149229 RepID=A0AAU7JDJ3_9HYPH